MQPVGSTPPRHLRHAERPPLHPAGTRHSKASLFGSFGCLPLGISLTGLTGLAGLTLGTHTRRAITPVRCRTRKTGRRSKEQSAQSLKLPKCVVFDLDGCLWYPEMYELSWAGGGAPFRRDDSGKIHDKRGHAVRLHSGVDAALTELATDAKWRGVVVAVASCCDVPKWAYELLGKFEFGPARKKLASIIEVRQIHKGSKQSHFREISGVVGCHFDEMIFFDNEKYNCDEVSRLGSALGWSREAMRSHALGSALKYAS